MPRHKRRRPNATALLDLLYARIPEVHCKGLCVDSCSVIGLHEGELYRIEKRLGHELMANKEGQCNALVDGRCSVYTIRPVVCRLFGAVRKMACPHGCQPDRWMSPAEAQELMEQVARLAGGALFTRVEESAAPMELLLDYLSAAQDGREGAQEHAE